MRSKFKDEHPFEKRKAEAERIRQKYSDRIPVCRPRPSGRPPRDRHLSFITYPSSSHPLAPASAPSAPSAASPPLPKPPPTTTTSSSQDKKLTAKKVICEKVEKSDIATIDKKKYLVPADLTVGQFVYVIRKRIKLSPEKAIFIFVDEVLPPTAALMSSIYEEHKDEDGYVFSLPGLFLGSLVLEG